ncbi:MAG: hypothetical protein KDC57_01925, partial [Saprospiraceae bacterium]|nr:hypothetical protein [Saprospiraceae bacterium]
PDQDPPWTQPQQIVFSWLPQHLGAFPVEYVLYLYEWPDGMSLDQVWAYQAPLTVTSMTNNYLWGPAEVPLDTGITYVARVRITDLRGEAVFKNNGYSQERTFRLRGLGAESKPCDSPSDFTAVVLGERIALSWAGAADTFRIHYQQADRQANWQWYLTEQHAVQLDNFQRGATYAFVVAGRCGQDWLGNGDTLWVTIPVEQDTMIACGEEVPPIQNQQLLPVLSPGDVVTAGGVPVEIVNATGGNGIFSGTGAFRLRYLPAVRIGVSFKNIRVNTDHQLIEGHMETLYDPSWNNIPSVNLDFSRQPQELAYREWPVAVDVDSVWVDEEGRIWIVDNTGQEQEVTQETTAFDEPPVPVLIIDIHGDVWRIIDGVVLEEGQDGVETVIENGNSNVDGQEVLTGAAEALVLFREEEEQAFGFDAINQEKLADYYEKLDGDYYVAYKSVGSARKDGVVATVNQLSGVHPDSLIFESENGSRWPPAVWEQTSTTLPVVGKGDKYEEAIYALVRDGKAYTSVGKLNTVSYDPVPNRVILVPVGAPAPIDAAGLEEYLNKVYRQAVASWKVEVDASVLRVDWDPEGDGLNIDRGLVDKYHPSLDRIIKAYQQQRGIDPAAYYAFLIPRMQDASIQGFMPRGGRFAFIAAGSNIAQTLAHELGHGAFTLAHIFAEDATLERQTDNLMDYSGGTHLMKHQWDRIHDPKSVWGLFEGEEEGELILGSAFYYEHYVYFQHDRGEDYYGAYAPDGTRIILPNQAVASFFPTDGGAWPKGSLTGFTFDDKTYLGWWLPDEKKFLGYAIAIRDESTGLITHEKEFYQNGNEAPYTYQGYTVEGCDQVIEWDIEKDNGKPWIHYETGTGVTGPCGCYYGPCAALLTEYKDHPYLDPGTALAKVVCQNPCLLEDMRAYQYFVPQYSQWMEEVNKMFMGMLAIGLAPLAAAAAVEIIPMAVSTLEAIVLNKIRTKGIEFATGFCIDIALNGAIEYYFLDNPHPFEHIDLAQASASGLEAMIDAQNPLYEVVGAAALSCLTDGFTEDGKIRDEFAAVECGKGMLSSVISDLA